MNRAVMFYQGSGGAGKVCPPSTDPVPYSNETWVPPPGEVYTPTAEAIAEFRQTLFKYHESGNSVGRFTAALGDRYPSVGAHGLALWGEANSHCLVQWNGTLTRCVAAELIGGRFPCLSEGGPHIMTAEFLSVFGSGATHSHHPPAGQHLFRGEMIAYIYGHIFLDALAAVEQGLAGDAQAFIKTTVGRLETLQPAGLPHPKHCKDEYCRHRPVCFSNYAAHFEPKYRLDAILAAPPGEGWSIATIGLPGCDPANKFGYVDCRYAYASKAPDSVLHFHLNLTQSDAFVFVCGNEHINQAGFHIHAPSSFDALRPGGGDAVQAEPFNYAKKCMKLKGIRPGQHVLSISNSNKAPELQITHIITY